MKLSEIIHLAPHHASIESHGCIQYIHMNDKSNAEYKKAGSKNGGDDF